MLTYLLTAFGAGLLALVTPCVFPMIPVTLAFFTKQSTKDDGELNRGHIVRLALTYCIGIIVAFVLIGVGLAVTVGGSGAYRFATHPITNLFFALLFIVFGLSMLEVFLISLPAKWQNLAGGRRSGTWGVLVMGLTFVITAFTCTAPFMGSVLLLAQEADSASSFVKPVLGMATFATALALPFFLLALFPPLLAKLPRSGGWMVTVKGALGFLEIAAALKFLSNADLSWTWNLISREVFLTLSALTVIGGSFWLLGKFHVGHGTPSPQSGWLRKTWAGVFMVLGLYCIYGIARPMDRLFETYVPPYRAGGATGEKSSNEGTQLVWLSKLEDAQTKAQAEKKRVLIDFTGHT